jgi:hypothetical protein
LREKRAIKNERAFFFRSQFHSSGFFMFFCGIVLADSRFCGWKSRSFPEKCGVVIFRGTQIIFLRIMWERLSQNNGFSFPLFFMKGIKKQEIEYRMKGQKKKKFVDEWDRID